MVGVARGGGCRTRMAQAGSTTGQTREPHSKPPLLAEPLSRPTRPRPCAHPAQVAVKPLMSIPSKAGAKRSHASVAQSLVGSGPARLLLRLPSARLAAPGSAALPGSGRPSGRPSHRLGCSS